MAKIIRQPPNAKNLLELTSNVTHQVVDEEFVALAIEVNEVEEFVTRPLEKLRV